HTEDENAVPYLTEQTVARYSCRVVGKLDAGTHMVFLGEVQEAQVLEEEDAMTYAYYHLVKKGLTPPKASSYRPEPAVKGYRCKICGYVLESDTLPEDFICPICKRGSEAFEPVSAE
ncbi:MAG: rubredoxin-like domain-containing protein, partial [Neglectibacter sp.]